MSPDGVIYSPEQVEELNQKAKEFARDLIPLEPGEAESLRMLKREDRLRMLRHSRNTGR